MNLVQSSTGTWHIYSGQEVAGKALTKCGRLVKPWPRNAVIDIDLPRFCRQYEHPRNGPYWLSLIDYTVLPRRHTAICGECNFNEDVPAKACP